VIGARPRIYARRGLCFACHHRPRKIKSYCRPCWAAQQRGYQSRRHWKMLGVLPHPNMTFEEIGRELGITPTQAHRDFCSGMKKVLQETEGLRRMRELTEERNRALPLPDARYGLGVLEGTRRYIRLGA